jgi:hypothetical protein
MHDGTFLLSWCQMVFLQRACCGVKLKLISLCVRFCGPRRYIYSLVTCPVCKASRILRLVKQLRMSCFTAYSIQHTGEKKNHVSRGLPPLGFGVFGNVSGKARNVEESRVLGWACEKQLMPCLTAETPSGHAGRFSSLG